ncbi:MAG: PKD domain-containing protein [Bacteroidia bacterium]
MNNKLIHILIGLIVSLASASAQVACGYVFEYTDNIAYSSLPNNQETLILASGSAVIDDPTAVSPTDEDFFPQQSIGFPFIFNGQSYTTCGVATNGWIWFGNINPVKAAGVVIPFTNILQADTEIEGIISALNGDLEGRWTAGLASIRTSKRGTSPNREFIIEWNNFKALDDAEGTGYCGENRNRFDFQIILQEQNNKISFAYRASEYCWQGYEQYFQIGLRGNNRTDVHTRSIASGQNSWNSSNIGFNTSTAVIRSSSPVNLPPENARFSFFSGEPQAAIWLGNSNSWNDPSNWSTGMVPGRCNDVTIPGGLSHYPELSGNTPASCANLIIQPAAAVTLNENYNSFLSCFGNLINNGVISNNTNTYITLAGSEQSQIGGSGHFIGADLFVTAESEYHLINDLVIRNLSINSGASLHLEEHVLDVFSIIQNGTIDQGSGILVIEGDASAVQLTDSTFHASSGTTFFGNGEVWSNLVNQTVPSINYNNLWIRTNKNFEVQLGSNEDFTCRNLLFYNPGEAGGFAKTARSINVLGDFRLGIDSLPGTSLQINHAIQRINNGGAFHMGKEDALTITHAPVNQQTAITGFQNPVFNGSVTYNSGSTQTLVNGTYTNLNINGSGVRRIQGKVKLKGVLKLNDGVLETNDSLSLKSDSLSTGLISGQGNGSITGEVESERYIHGEGSQTIYISSPFEGLQIIDYSSAIPVLGPNGVSFVEDNSPSIWEYKGYEVDNQFVQGWYSVGSGRTVMQGMGMQTALQGGSVLAVKGSVNSGNISIPLSSEGNQENLSGYNLIGNPYPSPINWNKVSQNLPSTISKSIHRMGNGNAYNGTFATWLSFNGTEGLGINGATPYVGIQEAFFSRAFETDTLELRNSYREDIVQVNSVPVSSQVSYIRLSLTEGNKKDETLIYYAENTNTEEALDSQDALKMPDSGNYNTCYSIKEGLNLAIHGREITQQADSVALGMHIQASGFFKIRLSEIIHFPSTAMVFLEDRVNSNFQNMRQQPEYEVFLNAGEINNRFFIHYRPGIQVNSVREGCEGNDGQITLNNPTSTAWDVSVFNSLDSLVESRETFTGSLIIEDLPADEYRIQFILSGQNILIEEWIQVAQGSGITASFTASATEVKQDEEEVIFTNTTPAAQSLFWDFGDGMMLSGESEVSHIFSDPGDYPVVLTATRDECSDTAQITIKVITITGIDENSSTEQKFTLFPNPATTIAYIKLGNQEMLYDLEYVLVDAAGRIVVQQKLNAVSPGQMIELPVSGLSKGAYEVVISSGKFRGVSRLMVGSK